jgi:hypothetical protein
MTNYNFEGQPEGEWEDRGNLSWSELDWQQFLQRQEKEVARFLRFYDECPVEAAERLDWVARQMGWDSDDWSVGDFPEDEQEGDAWKPGDEEGRDPVDADPYTIHRHPVFVVCAGLFLQIRYLWRTALKNRPGPVDSLLCWDFGECLNEAEKHSLMAMQCMDVGDFLLCVVHLKRSLRGINLAMSLMPALVQTSSAGEYFRLAMLGRLFDLREVCLRVMLDCREEDRRNFRE